MTAKILKAVWFLSLIITMVMLLYSYASMPDTIVLLEEGVVQSISRSGLFYAALAIIGLTNALVFVVVRLVSEKEYLFRPWFYLLVAFLNLFMVVSLQFFSLYNSAEKFDYDSIGFIIYGSISMVIVWAALWPLKMIIQKFAPQWAILKDIGE